MASQDARAGGVLLWGYGEYHLAAQAAQEFMMRKNDHLCGFAAEVTFGDPVLTMRLIDIHTAGACPAYRGPTPQGLRWR